MSTPSSHHNDPGDVDTTHPNAADPERTDHEEMTSLSRTNKDGLRILTKEEFYSIMETGRCFTDCVIPIDMTWEDISREAISDDDDFLKCQHVHAQNLTWNNQEMCNFEIYDSSFDGIDIEGSPIDYVCITNSHIKNTINMNGVNSYYGWLVIETYGASSKINITKSAPEKLLLDNSNIPLTDLSDNKVEHASLRNMVLQGSNLRNTHVNKCDMENADLSYFDGKRLQISTDLRGFKALRCTLLNTSFLDAKMDRDTEIYLSDEFLDEVVKDSDQLEGFLESVSTIDWDEYEYDNWDPCDITTEPTGENHVKISLLDQLSEKIMAMPEEDRQKFIENNRTAIIEQLYQNPEDEDRPNFYLNPAGSNNSNILKFHNFLREHHSDKL